MKKNILSILILAVTLTFTTSCNDWLDVLPNNEQVTDDYWKSKEDVEAVIASGYYYMRQCVPTFIKWGELRGGSIYTTNTGLLFSGKKNDSWVRTVSDNETILMTYDFDHYDDVCSSLYKAQQKAYNNCEALYRSDLQELTDAQPNFRLENGRLIF